MEYTKLGPNKPVKFQKSTKFVPMNLIPLQLYLIDRISLGTIID